MVRRKGVRLEHIAAEVGVSIVTVSNALKGKSGVSDDMRARIRETADRLGYQLPEGEAAKKKASYIIGVMIAERYVKEFPSFYMDIYKRVAQEVTKRGSMTILEIVDVEKEKRINGFTAFQGAEMAGLIIIGEMNREYVAEVINKYNIPIVCVDHYDVLEGMDYIVTDSYGGMEQMTEVLLHAGCRELMFVGTPEATGNIMDRYMGFLKALETWGIEPMEQHVLPDRMNDRYGYKMDVALPEILPEGFVCNCDKTAKILLHRLRERGVKVPDEVSVVGFDHYYSQSQPGLALTTYENDEKVIAQISVSTLVRRIEGRKKAAGVRIVEGKVIYGNTVRGLNGKGGEQ